MNTFHEILKNAHREAADLARRAQHNLDRASKLCPDAPEAAAHVQREALRIVNLARRLQERLPPALDFAPRLKIPTTAEVAAAAAAAAKATAAADAARAQVEATRPVVPEGKDYAPWNLANMRAHFRARTISEHADREDARLTQRAARLAALWSAATLRRYNPDAARDALYRMVCRDRITGAHIFKRKASADERRHPRHRARAVAHWICRMFE